MRHLRSPFCLVLIFTTLLHTSSAFAPRRSVSFSYQIPLLRSQTIASLINPAAIQKLRKPTHLHLWGKQKSSRTTRDKTTTEKDTLVLDIGAEIGSGSYGTVHLCKFHTNENKAIEDVVMIAKRAWTEEDLIKRNTSKQSKEQSSSTIKEKAKRCESYFNVELHCFQKLRNAKKENSQIPHFLGNFPDQDGCYNWLVFELISKKDDNESLSSTMQDAKPAVTLADAIQSDWNEQHSDSNENRHHLFTIQKELGLSHDNPTDAITTLESTLDKVFLSLLSVMKEIHSQNIVHRDIKPANLLCDPKSHQFVLIDFGSAADMDPVPNQSFSSNLFSTIGIDPSGGRIGIGGFDGTEKSKTYSDNIAAVSPVYAAPEIFIQWDKSPLEFDVFSTALIFCQLLFNLLDERSDAAFHQQLKDLNYDLDIWLSKELFSNKVRFVGFEEALMYLGERPGLWQLLKDMLQVRPSERISSKNALKSFATILERKDDFVDDDNAFKLEDGPFFKAVLESMETCDVYPPQMVSMDKSTYMDTKVEERKQQPNLLLSEENEDLKIAAIPRPLHYIATFNRAESLGLILAEVDGFDDNEEEEMDTRKQDAWEKGTKDALDGEVFIRDIIDGGQAASSEFKGIFDIGDRLRGVGDMPFIGGGFESVVKMLSNQPKSSKTVKLHFDRKPTLPSDGDVQVAPHLAKIVGQGAWSVKGRRKAQEDAFVLHEIHDGNDNAILMAGVFDGHGGTAASTTVSQLLPSLFAAELASMEKKATSKYLEDALNTSWEMTCSTYQGGCDERGTCVADYDPVEGIVMAHIGSKDLIAGTTATAAVLSADNDGAEELIILNCGDSRALVFGRPLYGESSSVVHFCTRDHSPKDELERIRLQTGKDKGLDYSLPECSLTRWWLTVGDYQYAVSRSLEGNFATSKGIVFNADITNINLATVLAKRDLGIVFIASDGIFEVMDNEEIGRDLLSMRESGLSAGDAAKSICCLALEKGTSDNASAIVLYFE